MPACKEGMRRGCRKQEIKADINTNKNQFLLDLLKVKFCQFNFYLFRDLCFYFYW